MTFSSAFKKQEVHFIHRTKLKNLSSILQLGLKTGGNFPAEIGAHTGWDMSGKIWFSPVFFHNLEGFINYVHDADWILLEFDSNFLNLPGLHFNFKAVKPHHPGCARAEDQLDFDSNLGANRLNQSLEKMINLNSYPDNYVSGNFFEMTVDGSYDIPIRFLKKIFIHENLIPEFMNIFPFPSEISVNHQTLEQIIYVTYFSIPRS